MFTNQSIFEITEEAKERESQAAAARTGLNCAGPRRLRFPRQKRKQNESLSYHFPRPVSLLRLPLPFSRVCGRRGSLLEPQRQAYLVK